MDNNNDVIDHYHCSLCPRLMISKQAGRSGGVKMVQNALLGVLHATTASTERGTTIASGKLAIIFMSFPYHYSILCIIYGFIRTLFRQIGANLWKQGNKTCIATA